MSLEDWNNRAGHRYGEPWKSSMNVPNGIACPKCHAELVDCDRRVLLTSAPPKYDIKCMACGWKGYRYA